ncbi:heparinase [Rhodospirillales bacterium TMPK1]|uniref:Heparinase n=2 Tax=Roseiterribacter gracilis TaxID=2812848 RepID=A0A8S8XC21_9PROT|nr:heparinase [Rhodospirillales bacterium TMPK1]
MVAMEMQAPTTEDTPPVRRRGLRGWFYASSLYQLFLGSARPTQLLLVPPNPWPGDAVRGRTLIAAGDNFDAAMHRFDWLRDLRAAGGDAARRHARILTQAWLDRYSRCEHVAWAPDATGARLANWIGFHDFFCASADDAFRLRLFQSAARQAKHLARTLPGDLTGAPLLTAIKGLWLAALALPDGAKRAELAQRLLLKELSKQILADGVHVERSPRTHLGVLSDLIDLRAALKLAKSDIPDALNHAIDRMAPALRFFRHGDGALALFHGTLEGEPVLLDTVLTQADAKGRPLKSAPQGGFERLSMGRTVVIADVGAAPPKGLDAHAHASALSFEMSVGRERLIVNCGSAASGAWADALRATAAHSTVTVGDTSSHPFKVDAAREDGDGWILLDAAHEGYPGLQHRRRLFLGANGEDLRGEDILTTRVSAPFVIRFHLHPSVQASLTQSGKAALLRAGDGTFWRLRVDGAQLGHESSVYLGSGVPRRTVVLTLTGATDEGETIVKWALKRDKKT